MTVVVQRSGGRDRERSWAATVARAIVTLVVVTAIVAVGAGLAAYAVSRMFLALLP